MKAIILAAGKAPRLLPLTKDTPQCMLKIGKKTILELQIENIKKAGIKNIIVVTGYLSEKLEKFCEELGVKTFFNPFYEVSGMALSLWVAKEELKSDFVFLYSDILFDSKILQGLIETTGDICLAIKKNGQREEAEKVIEKEGIIEGISKTKSSKANGEFIGLAKFSTKGARELVNELNYVAKKDLDGSFISVLDNLITRGNEIFAFDIKHKKFSDIDFPKDLKDAEF